MPQWHRDPAFWDHFGPVFLEAQPDRPQLHHALASLLAVLAPVPGARILDLGCGAGAHALELAHRGYAVTGVDPRESLLAAASQRTLRRGLEIELLWEDPRRFRRPHGFDAILALGWGFGGLFGRNDPHRILTTIHSNLRPRGQLLIEAQGQEVLARNTQRRTVRDLQGGGLWIDRRTIRKDWSALDLRWTLIRGDHQHEAAFSLRLFSGPELETLLTEVGFRDIRLLGAPHGAPYDHRAQTLLALARR